MKYYTRLRGIILGPFSVEQLQSRARNGRFGRHYEVSSDQESWEPASKYLELFPSKPKSTTADQELGNEVSIAGADTAANAQEFYYAIDEEQIGPIKLPQLESMIRNGRLQADTLVWTHGFSEWVAVDEIPALESLLELPRAAEASIASPPRHSKLATWSLVCGLLGGTILVSPIAIVLGHMALSRIKASAGQLSGRKSAIAGLVLGYIVVVSTFIVSIIFVCLAILQDKSP